MDSGHPESVDLSKQFPQKAEALTAAWKFLNRRGWENKTARARADFLPFG